MKDKFNIILLNCVLPESLKHKEKQLLSTKGTESQESWKMMTPLQHLTHTVRGNVLNRGITTHGDALG